MLKLKTLHLVLKLYPQNTSCLYYLLQAFFFGTLKGLLGGPFGISIFKRAIESTRQKTEKGHQVFLPLKTSSLHQVLAPAAGVLVPN